MDAFFAAIEILDNPGLKGKPVIVGAPPDQRGVVSTASYEARTYGVKSATPSRVAYQRCPHAVFLPVRMERYKHVSEQVMNVLHGFSPLVEAVSVDEAFVDIGSLLHRDKTPEDIAYNIKNQIYAQTGLTCSVGLAPNKFLAKLASDYQKPDGLTIIPSRPGEIEQFLAPLPIETLWGVGPVTTQKLQRAGITRIADLQTCPVSELTELTGLSAAWHLKEIAKGRDDRAVKTEHEEKSISNETTFYEDCRDEETLHRTLIELVENVGRRLRINSKKAGTGQIKIRYANFRTLTRQERLRPPTSSDRPLLQCALRLFEREQISQPVRLLGFGATHLLDPEEQRMEQQPLLFRELEYTCNPESGNDRALDKAVDTLREQYGSQIIRRASCAHLSQSTRRRTRRE